MTLRRYLERRKNMKQEGCRKLPAIGARIALYVAVFSCLTGAPLFGQASSSGSPKDSKGSIADQVAALKLSGDELTGLEDIVLADNRIIQLSRGEVNADRAELTRLLLRSNVTTKDLEPTVRHSIEAEMQIRMAELDRQLKIRKLIGDARWASLSDLVVQFRSLPPQQQAGSSDDLTMNRIVNLLRLM
jgi:hypothetical protein